MSETHLTVQHGKVKRDVVKQKELDIEGKPIENKTVVRERKGSHPTRISDLYVLLEDAHGRIDTSDRVMKKVLEILDELKKEIRDVKDIQMGKNPEFENLLRQDNVPLPIKLDKSAWEIYGTQVPLDTLKLVQEVLGTDTYAFIKDNHGMPSALFTVLVPKRLSGNDLDFRSCTIYGATAEADIKKWCEKVKSNIFKMFTSQGKGTPKFMLPRSVQLS